MKIPTIKIKILFIRITIGKARVKALIIDLLNEIDWPGLTARLMRSGFPETVAREAVEALHRYLTEMIQDA